MRSWLIVVAIVLVEAIAATAAGLYALDFIVW